MRPISSLEEARKELQKYLLAYISKFEEGFDTYSKEQQINIRCFSKEHLSKEEKESGKTREDTPSLTYYPGNNTFYCHKEKKHLDIFHAAYFYEDMPITGSGFIKKTIPHLCSLFGLEYSEKVFELSETEKKAYRQYKIFEILENHVLKTEKKDFLDKENLKNVSEFSIGGADWGELYKEFQINNISKEELKQLNITAFTINANKLVYIIKNNEGKAIGFTSKEMINTKESIKKRYNINEKLTLADIRKLADLQHNSETLNRENSAESAFNELKFYKKYINNTNSLIFNKSKNFFGIELVLKDNPEKVFIFEGTKEVVKAKENGIYSLGFLGSGSKIDYSALNRSLIKEIIVCFDNDSAGEKAKINFIKKDLNLIRKKVLIGVYKKNIVGKDYDEIVKYKKIEIDDIFEYVEPFDYLIQHHKSNLNEQNNSDERHLIELVTEEIIKSDVLETQLKIKTLSKYTPSFSFEALNEHFKVIKQNGKINMTNIFKDIVLKNADSIQNNSIESVLSNIKKETESAFEKNKITETKIDIFNLMEKKVESFWKERINRKNRREVDFGFDVFNEIYGISGKKVITIVAKPNVGKTTFFCNLVYQLLKHHKDDVNMAYFTTDDSADDIISSLATRSLSLSKSIINNPFKEDDNIDNIKRLKYIEAIEVFLEEIITFSKNKTLTIPETSDMLNTLEGLETIAKQLSETDEKKLKILFIDSANKIKVKGVTDDNERIAKISEFTKEIALNYNLLIIQNFEPNKLKKKEKVDESKIRGSARMLHDSDALISLHQPLHELPDVTKTFDYNSNNVKIPIIVSILEKTKIGGIKNKPNFMRLDFEKNLLENVKEQEYEIFKKSFELDVNENYFKGTI